MTAYRHLNGLLLLCLLTFPHAGRATTDKQLPEIGAVASATISLAEEKRMGEFFMRGIRRSLPLLDDPEITDYLTGLGQRLTSQAKIRGRQFTFFVVDDPTINAFAGPGGYIGIHSGLILTTEDESELAAVLAHEIAHVSQRHLARAYEAAGNQALPMTAAILASILLGSHDSQAGVAALAGISAGSAQRQINFTRSNEQEADRIGLDILARAGFDPRAMPRFFSRLQQSQRLSDDLGLDFLRTHPVTIARMADTQGRADQYARQDPDHRDEFLYIQARARVLTGQSDDDQPVTTSLRQRLEKNGHDSDRYGYALALFESQQWSQASEQLTPLLTTQPQNLHVQLLHARLLNAQGKAQAARQTLRTLLAAYPDDWALTATLADIDLQSEKASEARQWVKRYIARRPPPPLAYHLLAQAENQLGDPVASHRYLAEYYNSNGETRAAIRQLQIALKRLQATPDPRTKTALDERLRELRKRLKEEERLLR